MQMMDNFLFEQSYFLIYKILNEFPEQDFFFKIIQWINIPYAYLEFYRSDALFKMQHHSSILSLLNGRMDLTL